MTSRPRNNLFITQGFDWNTGGSFVVRAANKVLEVCGRSARLRASGSTGLMTTVEIRSNLYHLVSQALAYAEGDLLEVGTFTGQTAVLIAKVIADESPGRALHVYDTFEPHWGEPNPSDRLLSNFALWGLAPPSVHAGLFSQSMARPGGLPERVAFAHLDCGFGGAPEAHGAVITDVLRRIYPLMSPGAVCSFVDYWDPVLHAGIHNANPGVRPALDGFLEGRAERITVLHGGEYCHAYFRKI